MKVKIIEVGPRDGLQNEVQSLTLRTRLKLIKGLYGAGLKNIEVGSFVHPKWIPQMEGSDDLINQLNKWIKKQGHKDLKISALVPNLIGFNRALDTEIKEIAIFTSTSDTFSKTNINCSVMESFKRFKPVVEQAKARKIKVRGYLSTSFGCPYEGKVSPGRVLRLTEKLLKLGVYEVSVSDTIGAANPKQVRELSKRLIDNFPKDKIAMHFHDTRGMALANVYASFIEGITTFDSSVGGLGGCPYAKGASGNLCTEDLVHMFESMKVKTGVNLTELLKVEKWLEKEMGRSLNSKMSKINS